MRQEPPGLRRERGAGGDRRGYGAGLTGSLVLHVLLLVALLHTQLGAPAPEMQPLAVTILAAVPPPPPPPPPASSAAQPQVETAPEQMAVERKVEAEKPQVVAQMQKPTARPRPRKAPTPRAVEAAPDGVASGVTGGVDGGVGGGKLGGTEGGQVGGTVGGAGEGPIPVDRVASPPVVLHQVRPEYPAMARVRGREGLVLLELVIDRDGRVERDSVQVRESAPAFDAAAVAAVRQWRFRPGRDAGGMAVRVILEVPIRFQLR